MEAFEHNGGGPFFFGWGLYRYRLGRVTPFMVKDELRGIAKPEELGEALTGGFDLHVDGTFYTGLSAPFVLADLGADLYRAVPSAADVSVDYLLQPGGGRNTAPDEIFVPGETDLWSIGI